MEIGRITMKVKCLITGTEHQSPIVGDEIKSLEECVNWLSIHLRDRTPKEIVKIGEAGQLAIAVGLMARGESESELWNKTFETQCETLFDKLNLDTGEEEEEDEQEVYAMGFEDCIDQIVKRLRAKGLTEEADEIAAMEVEVEPDDMGTDAGDGGIAVTGVDTGEDGSELKS
jgi:hypothetical protein